MGLVQGDVQAGQQLLERWGTRNEAIAQLEAVMDEVSGPVTSQSSPSRGQEGVSQPHPTCHWLCCCSLLSKEALGHDTAAEGFEWDACKLGDNSAENKRLPIVFSKGCAGCAKVYQGLCTFYMQT